MKLSTLEVHLPSFEKRAQALFAIINLQNIKEINTM